MKKIEWFAQKGKPEDLRVSLLMEDEVITCSPGTSAMGIAHKLCTGHFGSLPVVDEEKNLVGLVSEFDLLRAIEQSMDFRKITAADVMTRKVITVTEETSFMELIKLLQKHHLIRVPVVRESRLVGIVARRDIILGHILSDTH